MKAAVREHIQDLGQQLRQGRVILHTPALLLAAECATRFLLAAALAGAEILGSCYPFALGLVACSGSGITGFCALLGAVTGYFLQLGLANSLRYIAAAILIYAVAFALYDTRFYRRSWFMPLWAGLLCGITGFVVLSEQGWTAITVVSFTSEVCLAATSAWLFRIALPFGEERRDSPAFRSAALLLLLAAALISLAQVKWATVTLGGICAGVIALTVGWRGGAGRGAVTGLTLGLALDLSAGGGSIYACLFALAGLFSALGSRWGRLGATGFGLCAAIAAGLWALPAGDSVTPMLDGIGGCVVFLILPPALLSQADSLLPPNEGPPPPAAVPVMATVSVRSQLEQQAAAYRSLYHQLRTELEDIRPQKEMPEKLALRAMEQVCPGCPMENACHKSGHPPVQLEEALAAMLERGRGQQEDFPPVFAARCPRLTQMRIAAGGEVAASLNRRQYRARLRESRSAVCCHYAQLSRLLELAAVRLTEPPQPAGEPPLAVSAGGASRRRLGQEVSGDGGAWFRDGRNQLWVALCDGMGSGREAARDSRLTLRLLEDFLKAAVEPESALAIISGALALRGDEEGGFTTIDLLRIHLITGDGSLYKLGAAPTYLRRRGQVGRVTGSALPAGLDPGGGGRPDITHFQLAVGDLVVLVSDGITDGYHDDWLRRLVALFQGESPRELAADILAAVPKDTPGDDCSVIVLRLERRDGAEDDGGSLV